MHDLASLQGVGRLLGIDTDPAGASPHGNGTDALGYPSDINSQ